MATATTPTTTDLTTPDFGDVVRRGIVRALYCKLTEEEFTRIAKTRAVKEAERDELLDDLKREVEKRKAQIKDLEDEISKMGRELRTNEQERAVKCNEVFRKHEDGSGWIYVIRLDTFDEVERRGASPHEMQRYLPSMDGGGGLLAQATAKQAHAERSAQPETEGAAAPESDGEDVPADDGDGADEDVGADDAGDEQGDEQPKKRGGKKGGK